MRILAISDIILSNMPLGLLSATIKKTRPDLVLLGGDLVDDKQGCVHGRYVSRNTFWPSVEKLFRLLSRNRVQTFFIRGNWDNRPYYDELASRGLPYIEEISGKISDYGGLKVLGIPFAQTDCLETAKAQSSAFPEPVDIVLAHAELARRMWLFRLNTKAVITGHFDPQCSSIKGKLFLSLGEFPREYATINWQPSKLDVAYVRPRARPMVSRATMSEEGWVWRTKPPEEWSNYAKRMDGLLLLHERAVGLDRTEKERWIRQLLAQGVSQREISQCVVGGSTLLKMIRQADRTLTLTGESTGQ